MWKLWRKKKLDTPLDELVTYYNAMCHGHAFYFKQFKENNLEILRHMWILKQYIPEEHYNNLKEAYELYNSLKDKVLTPFIILDEPTASLDPIAEAEIYSKFNEIVGDKTAIYISHRLSSCVFCDEVVVFDNGHIVQHDTHKNLLKDENGKYFELWNAQAQYYK